MRFIFKILGLSLFIMEITSCAGSKDFVFEKNPPFTVTQAYFQKWVAGVKGGGSGTNVHITLTAIKEELKIEEIF